MPVSANRVSFVQSRIGWANQTWIFLLINFIFPSLNRRSKQDYAIFVVLLSTSTSAATNGSMPMQLWSPSTANSQLFTRAASWPSRQNRSMTDLLDKIAYLHSLPYLHYFFIIILNQFKHQKSIIFG